MYFTQNADSKRDNGVAKITNIIIKMARQDILHDYKANVNHEETEIHDR